jgi:hypothetical protein
METSQELYNALRSRFSNLDMGGDEATLVTDPKQAKFFDFDFKAEGKAYGRVSISLAEDGKLKLFYTRGLTDEMSDNIKSRWYEFLKNTKTFAQRNMLEFDARDITKQRLQNKDFEFMANTQNTVNTDAMAEEINRITKLADIQEVHPMAGEISRLAGGMNDQKAQEIINKIGPENLSQLKKHSTMGHSLPDTVKKDPGMKDTVLALTAIDDIAINGFDSKLLQLIFSKIGSEKKITADITESMYGSSRRSYTDLDETKLIIRHSKAVDEDVPGARSRHIDSLYIENAEGERFKYPVIHLNGARAMQRHIANGGKPYDEIGESIIKMSEAIASLNSFKQYASGKDSMNENSADLLAKVKTKLEALKEKVQLIQNQKYYEAYTNNFFKTQAGELPEDKLNAYREQFSKTTYDERLDQLFPLVDAIVKEEEYARYQSDAEQFIRDPNSELILSTNDARDAKTQMLVKGITADDKNTKMRLQAIHILGDIGSRMIPQDADDDKIANFASDMSHKLEIEDIFMQKDPAYQKAKHTAFALAGKYMSDLKNKDKDEIRKSPEEIKKFKNIKGQEYGDKSKEYGKKEGIDESIVNMFESAMNMIVEGTWSLPETEEEFEKMKEIMSKHLPVGKDAMNATSMAGDMGIGDDTLYDQLGDLYDAEGADACARNTIRNWVIKNLVNGGFAYKYSTDEIAKLKDAVAQQHQEEPHMAEIEAKRAGLTPVTPSKSDHFEDIKDYVMSHFNTEEKSFPMGETGIIQSTTKKFGDEFQPIIEKMVTILSGKEAELVDEDDVEENAFNTARDKAIADNKDSFTFNGKTYKVTGKDAADEKRADQRFGEQIDILKRLSGI